ncbi:MAG TPA: hypothetical protein VJ972_07035 [Anaerolineales bacterium]|nr:hypothetical protein [Anaerolineales bacterium]
MMSKLIRPAIIAVLVILLALSCTVVAFSTKAPALGKSTGAAFFLQTTPTPPIEEDQSEVGSTDEIVIMGGVIALIVLLPILAQRRSWMQTKKS